MAGKKKRIKREPDYKPIAEFLRGKSSQIMRDVEEDDAQHKILTNFLKNEQKQTESDKDVFTKLIEKVIVNSREDITFIFKDGMEVREIPKV